ncbi:MAG: hypothetical protein ABI723_09760 [Bacteroidia bacterium]
MRKKNKFLNLVIAIALTGFVQNALAQSDHNNASYKTGIGLRGGWTSGLSIKHFISGTGAIEGILGTRWHGLSVTGLYEINKANALGVSRLSWEYGGGVRFGFYNGRYYHEWNDKFYYNDRDYTVVSIVGIFGLEYHFEEVPFTLGLDLMPYFDFVGRGDSFIDGSLSFRYAF